MMATRKVFSLFKTKTYSELFPYLDILGKKVDFFIECTSYDMILPVKVHEKKALDIFEDAVLKLINCSLANANVEYITETLCLDKDLVNFIIIRLQEIEFLDNTGRRVTLKGKNYLNDNINNDDIEFIQAKAFVLYQTGELLPYIHKGEFISEKSEKLDKDTIKLELGTAGSPFPIKGKIISQPKASTDKNNSNNKAKISDIKNAICRFNRIARKNYRFDIIDYDSKRAIEYSPAGNVLLHMQAVIQNGNVDEILVSDGFVPNVDCVKKYIQQNNIGFIGYVKQSAFKSVKSENKEKESVLNYFKNDKLYNLKEYMKKINNMSYFYRDEDEIHTLDENKNLKAEQKKFLINCYAALEWCLYYYIRKHPVDSNIKKILESQSHAQNESTIFEMAHKLRIQNIERSGRLFCSIDGWKIQRMYKDEIPDMRVVLGMAIIVAAKDGDNGFRKLVDEHPDMFELLQKYNIERNELAHESIMYEIDKDKTKMIYELLIDFIKYLHPDFDNKIVEKNKQNIPISQSQERLNAEVSLSKEMGITYFYNILPENIKEEWILIAKNKLQNLSLIDYVGILYRIMQSTLQYELKDISIDSSMQKSDILEKLNKKGIQSDAFDKVNDSYVNDIVHNCRSTLGATAMVYLYYQEDDKLEKLIDNNFVFIVDEIVKIRKHANDIPAFVDIDMLNELREKLLKIVKVIGGI